MYLWCRYLTLRRTLDRKSLSISSMNAHGSILKRRRYGSPAGRTASLLWREQPIGKPLQRNTIHAGTTMAITYRLTLNTLVARSMSALRVAITPARQRFSTNNLGKNVQIYDLLPSAQTDGFRSLFALSITGWVSALPGGIRSERSVCPQGARR